MPRKDNRKTVGVGSQQLMDELKLFIRLMAKIEETCCTVDDVKDILGVTRRQVVYWYAQGVEPAETEDHGKVSWYRFSIPDVMGFGGIKELRDCGLPLECCLALFHYIRDNVTRQESFIYRLAAGERVILYVSGDRVGQIYETHMNQGVFERWAFDHTTVIFLSLNEIFRRVMEKSRRKDFEVKFVQAADRIKAEFFMEGQLVVLGSPSKIKITSADECTRVVVQRSSKK